MTHTTEQATGQATVHQAPSPVTSTPGPPRRSRRTSVVEVMIAVGLLAALTLTLLVITSGSDPQRVGTPPAPTGVSLPGVPLSADGAERHFRAGSSVTRLPGSPLSADGAERHLLGRSLVRPAGVPVSADAAERYLTNRNE